MLADHIVSAAARGVGDGKMVELAVPGIDLSEISQIQHVGGGLLKYRYPGLDADHYVIDAQVLLLRIRPFD